MCGGWLLAGPLPDRGVIVWFKNFESKRFGAKPFGLKIFGPNTVGTRRGPAVSGRSVLADPARVPARAPTHNPATADRVSSGIGRGVSMCSGYMGTRFADIGRGTARGLAGRGRSIGGGTAANFSRDGAGSCAGVSADTGVGVGADTGRMALMRLIRCSKSAYIRISRACVAVRNAPSSRRMSASTR